MKSIRLYFSVAVVCAIFGWWIDRSLFFGEAYPLTIILYITVPMYGILKNRTCEDNNTMISFYKAEEISKKAVGIEDSVVSSGIGKYQGGVLIEYVVEFQKDSKEYSCIVDAKTGEVIEKNLTDSPN